MALNLRFPAIKNGVGYAYIRREAMRILNGVDEHTNCWEYC